jgi:histone H3/H4
MSDSDSPVAAGSADEDVTIPRAAMNKMIKDVVPGVRVANEARELVLNCCTEFIHLLASEANDVCNGLQKKTISPEHVLIGETVPFMANFLCPC